MRPPCVLPTVDVVWDSKTFPKEAFCLTVTRRDNIVNGDDIESQKAGYLNVSSSCCVDVTGGRAVESKCLHSETVLNDEIFCIVIRIIISKTRAAATPTLDCPSSVGDKLTPTRTGRLFGFTVQKQLATSMQQSVVCNWRFSVV